MSVSLAPNQLHGGRLSVVVGRHGPSLLDFGHLRGETGLRRHVGGDRPKHGGGRAADDRPVALDVRLHRVV